MRSSLPSTETMLEALGDSVIGEIDRLATAGFDNALGEMVRYHRFLLAINSTTTEQGDTFSYSELTPDGWRSRHTLWIKQYRRIALRAANCLGEDDHFVKSIAYIPQRLLANDPDIRLSPDVTERILDLFPMLVHRIQDWVTKRSLVPDKERDSTLVRGELPGSDDIAYRNLLPNLVGGWESVLTLTPIVFGWADDDVANDPEAWRARTASWPLIRQHLKNSAYALAAAVWNGDKAGAEAYRDLLVRWPGPIEHYLNDGFVLPSRRYLYPNILELSWEEALKEIERLKPAHYPTPGARELFSAALSSAKDDIILVTCTLLLYWTTSGKTATGLSLNTAGSLLRLELEDDEDVRRREADLTFRTLLLQYLRLHIPPYGDGSYSGSIDEFARSLDSMTERKVVPGRGYTPSTVHGFDQLAFGELAVLLSSVSTAGEGFAKTIAGQLFESRDALPEGDRSLRRIQDRLEQHSNLLEYPLAGIQDAADRLALSKNDHGSPERLRELFKSIRHELEQHRLAELRTLPISQSRIDLIADAVEAELRKTKLEVPVFNRVEGDCREGEVGELTPTIFNGITKASLVDPPMESEVSNWTEWFASATRKSVGRHVWQEFVKRSREPRAIAHSPTTSEFWSAIQPLLTDIGSKPVLVLRHDGPGRQLRRYRFDQASRPPGLVFSDDTEADDKSMYIATINGVAVYGASFSEGTAWLFSSEVLARFGVSAVEGGRLATVSYEPGEELEGKLVITTRVFSEWRDKKIYELKSPHEPSGDDEIFADRV